MKKFIFSIVAVAFMGMFAACDGCKSTTECVENDSTVVDSTVVDSTAVDSTEVVDTVVVDSVNVDTATVQK